MGLFDFGKKPQRNGGSFGRSSYNPSVSPMEKYIREEERWHAWECPHEDPYDCDGDCF